MLKAVVLLAGAVRENALVRSSQRPLLEMPLNPAATILATWRDSVSALRTELGLDGVPLVVSTTTTTDLPSLTGPSAAVSRVVPDAAELRGTGGALRDLADQFEPDDLIVVANGHSALLGRLESAVAAMVSVDADVVLHAEAGRVPSGIMLVRAGALLGIARRGFVDFKEQALPRIAGQHRVRVVVGGETAAVPVRTLASYVRALRLCNRQNGGALSEDPFAEEWPVSFSLVENGAVVSPEARIHDSVVLSGAVVERGAIMVRSVAGPGSRVGQGEFVCDQILPERTEGT
jgi:NDP-sugar pyrophosphorylase family protein